MVLEVYLPRADEEFLAALEEVGTPDGVRLVSGESPGDPCYEVLVSGRPTEEELTASEALRRVVVPFAGIPPKTLELVRAHSELELYNLHHNAHQTAEMAVTLMLAAGNDCMPCAATPLRSGRTPSCPTASVRPLSFTLSASRLSTVSV